MPVNEKLLREREFLFSNGFSCDSKRGQWKYMHRMTRGIRRERERIRME